MVTTRRLRLQTRGLTDIVDITSMVEEAVREAGPRSGTATIYVPGSTAGVTTVEYEPGLIADLKAAFERLAPRDLPYQHDRAWGEGNGFSHVRASILGPSLTVPIVDGALALGTWQQIVVIDFDNRPRSREVLIQMVREP